jgi:hypothetical protein
MTPGRRCRAASGVAATKIGRISLCGFAPLREIVFVFLAKPPSRKEKRIDNRPIHTLYSCGFRRRPERNLVFLASLYALA